MAAQTNDRISEGICLYPFRITRTKNNSDSITFQSSQRHSKYSPDSFYDAKSSTFQPLCCSNNCDRQSSNSASVASFLEQSEVPKLGNVISSHTLADAIPTSAKMKRKASAPQLKRNNKRKLIGFINMVEAETGGVNETGEEAEEESDQQGDASMPPSGKLHFRNATNSLFHDHSSSSRNCSWNSRNLESPSESTEKAAQERDHGLHLVSLLLKCATAVANNERRKAALILGEIHKRAGMYGDAMQRLSVYFAESLAARLVLKDSPLYKTLMMQPSPQEFFQAFAALHKVSPCFQFAHFTCNQVILEAFEGHQILHVIDINTSRGFQWSSLLQSLAARPEGPPNLLRVTGIGRSEKMLRETADRLSNFAKNVNICFNFEAIVQNQPEELSLERLVVRPGEAVAVNCVFELHRLLNDNSGRKITEFITAMRRLRPLVLTIVEQEANHNAPTFLSRFMEALHYYAAIFDSLDASFPQKSVDRLRIEQIFFARQIKNIVACEDEERVERHESSESWKERMEKMGFELVHLSEHAISQAKLLLHFFPSEGYRLTQKGGLLSLGWQERQLITASAWTISRPGQPTHTNEKHYKMFSCSC